MVEDWVAIEKVVDFAGDDLIEEIGEDGKEGGSSTERLGGTWGVAG